MKGKFMIYGKMFLCCFMIIFLFSGCVQRTPEIYLDFYEYEDELLDIATEALKYYRAQNKAESVYIYFGSDNGYCTKSEERFWVSDGLYDLMYSFKNNESSQHFDYLIIGDTFVTFTKEQQRYALIYTEDGVRPMGEFKYWIDWSADIHKISDQWYELYVPRIRFF